MTTNVIDLEWVPVTRDGSEATVSLRSALRDAHIIDGLGAGLLPVEREALLRLLESLTAAVLHGADPGDLEDRRQIPADAVDRFLADRHGLFDLADPDRPFLQEWHTPAPDPGELSGKQYRPLEQLHVRVPGGSSADWGTSTEARDAADPCVLAVLLTVAWFHGKPSNAGGASFYRPTSGQKRSPISGAPSGGPRDTVFHLVGDTLAQTLLLNIPRGWLASDYPPAWLDQDVTPPAAFCARPGTLWRCTWTANRVKVAWDAHGPTAFTVGLTQRMIPVVGDLTGRETEVDVWKANAKAVSRGDYCRPLYADKKTPGTFLPVRAPLGLGTAEGYERWYRSELSAALSAWADDTPRAITPPERVAVGFHNEEGDTYGNRYWSEWHTVPLAELAIVGEPLQALRAVTAHVTTLVKAVGSALRSGFSAGAPAPDPTAVRKAVYAALDEPVLASVAQAATGTTVDDTNIREAMTRSAARAFADATESLLTPATCAAVYRARTLFRRFTHPKEDA